MSLVETQSEFHVALNGQGLLLQGAPGAPGYQQSQAPLYGNRFAQGDRSYNDLSKWWYHAQTDWSGGIKDEVAWQDDARFFASTNVDVWSEPGSVKLTLGLAVEKDCADNITFGSYETIGDTPYPYFGTEDDSSVQPKLWRKESGVWSELISGYIPNTAMYVADAMGHKNMLWVITMQAVGASTYAVFKCAADGSGATDYTAAIATAMGWATVTGGSAIATDGNTLYVAVTEVAVGSRKFGIVKTANAGATWTAVNQFTTMDIIHSMIVVSGHIVYLIGRNGGFELRDYSLVDSVDTSIQFFKSTGYDTDGVSASRRMIHSFQGRVIVIIPDKEIWDYNINAGTLTRLLSRNDFKQSLYSNTAELSWSLRESTSFTLLKGGMVHDNKLWFGNLMYDGDVFYNTRKNYGDSLVYTAIPIFSNGITMYWVSEADPTILYRDDAYKGTADKNYILFNNFDVISIVDKLLYATTILFKTLATGDKITVEYLTGELTNSSTFTVLGSASYAADGAITSKKLLFPVGTTFKKIWIRVKLEGGGTTTPTLTDVVTEFLPFPTQKKQWHLRVNCGDEVKRLNGGLVTKTGRELKNLLDVAWWTKSTLDFQDLDYAGTAINAGAGLTASATTITVDNTSQFPEQGRLRIEDEECLYTGKTATTFTGVTRGTRETLAVTHADNVVVSNAYKVIMSDLSSVIPIILEGKQLEYIVDIGLREV